MKTSKLFSLLAGAAFFAGCACFGMMFISAFAYLFTDVWLVMTGANWFFWSVGLGVVALVCLLISSGVEKVEKREAEAARQREAERMARERAKENHAAAQKQLFQTVTQSNASATASLERLPSHLEQATQFLNQADTDWNERVFNPFWTSIEGCAMALAAFSDDVEAISAMARQYEAAAAAYEGTVPPFSVSAVSVGAMESYKRIYDGMSDHTRRALGDIEFATIYETWHGNRIMIAGFKDLRSAVTQMSVSISGQISSLKSSIGSMSQNIGSLAGAVNMQTGAINAHASASAVQSAALTRATQDSARHEKEIANRLWNIEHGYKSLT
ncbi:hypothetical protein ACUY3U_20760 [Gordonia amicalis]